MKTFMTLMLPLLFVYDEPRVQNAPAGEARRNTRCAHAASVMQHAVKHYA